jgi:hypothetical protein
MRPRKLIFLAFSLWLLGSANLGRTQVPQLSEYQIKAAFLYNFGRFVDWPAAAFTDGKSPFIFGILGDNPFGKILDQSFAGKILNGHPVVVQVIHSLPDAAHCQILFISSSEKDHLAKVIQGLHAACVLTVSENDQFIEAGGMINFVTIDNKVRFQINDEAAKAAQLKISSKLLGLAVSSTN